MDDLAANKNLISTCKVKGGKNASSKHHTPRKRNHYRTINSEKEDKHSRQGKEASLAKKKGRLKQS